MHIYIAGDSTAANKSIDKKPESGWGEYLPDFYKKMVNITNFALNGCSTKSFIDDGMLKKIEALLQNRDIVLIQFGHNDQKKEDPSRYADPIMFYANLKTFVDTIKNKNAIPILLTPITRRSFLNTHQIDKNTHGEYPGIVLEFARNHQVYCIDTFKLSQNYFESLGDEESKKYFLHLQSGENDNYPNGIEDNSHFSEKGAKMMAQIITQEMLKLPLGLKLYINL
ncbi:MAG: rhamnogalacturonan acetylesterase [Acholeplasmataceae bacterium]|nr:rhamnogalacturonan acetylesterase [Acholeplasmataceae bacterium]